MTLRFIEPQSSKHRKLKQGIVNAPVYFRRGSSVGPHNLALFHQLEDERYTLNEVLKISFTHVHLVAHVSVPPPVPEALFGP
jgi:hypothetical protein